MIASSSAELKLAIIGLYDDYGATLDDNIADWPDLFTEDALYQIIARENYERGMMWPTMSCEGRGMLRDRVTAIQKTSVFTPRQMRHIIGGVRILDDVPGGYRTQATFLIGESGPDGESRMFAIGRYFDVVVRDDAAPNGFRFAEKTCVYDGNLIPSTLIFPF